MRGFASPTRLAAPLKFDGNAMSTTTIDPRLDAVKCRQAHCDLSHGGELSTVSRGVAIIDKALQLCGWTRDRLAREMGIAPSLLGRQLDDREESQHVSFQRLAGIADPSWQNAFVRAQIKGVLRARITTRIDLEESA